MSEHISIEVAEGVCTVALRRPEKKNALTQAMYAGLSPDDVKPPGTAADAVCMDRDGWCDRGRWLARAPDHRNHR